MVNRDGQTYLRIRQATRQGYVDCKTEGCADLNYPSSKTRRSRVIGGGNIAGTITSQSMGLVVFQKINYYDSTD